MNDRLGGPARRRDVANRNLIDSGLLVREFNRLSDYDNDNDDNETTTKMTTKAFPNGLILGD